MTILYFIAEPNAEQIAFARQHKMAIRNPRAYSASDYIEPCDFVYGDVPQAYLARFPRFELAEKATTQTEEATTQTEEATTQTEEATQTQPNKAGKKQSKGAGDGESS